MPWERGCKKRGACRPTCSSSIHADAFTTPAARGCQRVCAEPKRRIQHGRALAGQQRKTRPTWWRPERAAPKTSPRAARLLDMSTTAQINDSLKLGHRAAGRDRQRGQAAQAARGTSRLCRAQGTDIPSVLVRDRLHQQPRRRIRLRSSAHQQQLADALMRGITRYFARTYRWRAAGRKTPDGNAFTTSASLAAWWRRLSAAAALLFHQRSVLLVT